MGFVMIKSLTLKNYMYVSEKQKEKRKNIISIETIVRISRHYN